MFFIVCFSHEYEKRDTTFLNEELKIAIEVLRRKKRQRAWFIPVRLSNCSIPPLPIGPGETLGAIQRVDLFEDWAKGVNSILATIHMEDLTPPNAPVNQADAHATGNDATTHNVEENIDKSTKAIIKQDIIENHTPSPKAQDHLNIAQNLVAKNEQDKALSEADAACLLEPEWAEAFALKAEILLKLKQYQSCIYAANLCLDFREDYEAYVIRGKAKSEIEDFVGADSDFCEALRIKPAAEIYISKAINKVRQGDNGTAVSYIHLALQCPELLRIQIPTVQTAALYVVAGYLLHRKIGKPDEALVEYENALRIIPKECNEKDLNEFQRVCEQFELNIQAILTYSANFSIKPNVPILIVQKFLWAACKEYCSDQVFSETNIGRRDAVKVFRIHNIIGWVYTYAWETDPDFAFYMASIDAEKGEVERVIGWLEELSAARPEFELKVVRDYEYIRNCNSAKLREFLSPKLSSKYECGKWWNYLEVQNNSPFRVNSIVIRLLIDRYDGRLVPPNEFRLEKLNGWESWKKEGVFNDPGLFGCNIVKVNVEVECAEDEIVNIVLYNNDKTPMDFVEGVLTKFVGMDEKRANTTMLKVHNEGKAICATLNKSKAILIVNNINEYCNKNNDPLVCDVEPKR